MTFLFSQHGALLIEAYRTNWPSIDSRSSTQKILFLKYILATVMTPYLQQCTAIKQLRIMMICGLFWIECATRISRRPNRSVGLKTAGYILMSKRTEIKSSNYLKHMTERCTKYSFKTYSTECMDTRRTQVAKGGVIFTYLLLSLVFLLPQQNQIFVLLSWQEMFVPFNQIKYLEPNQLFFLPKPSDLFFFA